MEGELSESTALPCKQGPGSTAGWTFNDRLRKRVTEKSTEVR